MERTSLVLIVMGDDRPGLVEELAGTVAAAGGNWLESRMAHLAGKFAGILRVEVPPGAEPALRRALRGLGARGLEVLAEAGAAATGPSRPVSLELVGADHPGIVRDISAALARRGVNVEALETERSCAPLAGDPLFRARAALHVPEGLSIEELRRELEAVAHDLMVDLSLGPPGERAQGS